MKKYENETVGAGSPRPQFSRPQSPRPRSPQQCRERALYLLQRREHSRHELRRKLLSKGFAENDVEETIAKLASQSLQDDGRFAASYIRMRTARGYGPIKLRYELRERGVVEDIIEQELAAYDNEYWSELAQKVCAKKFGSASPKTWAERSKQKQFLYYKGFVGIDTDVDV